MTVPCGIDLQADVTLLMPIPVVPTFWHWGPFHALLHSPGIAQSPAGAKYVGPSRMLPGQRHNVSSSTGRSQLVNTRPSQLWRGYLELEEQALKGVPDVLCESHVPRVRTAIHAVRIEGPVKACARGHSSVFLPSPHRYLHCRMSVSIETSTNQHEAAEWSCARPPRNHIGSCAMHQGMIPTKLFPPAISQGVLRLSTALRSARIQANCSLPGLKSCSVENCRKWMGPWSKEYLQDNPSPSGSTL